jgi:thymidylate synthase (FAD)
MNLQPKLLYEYNVVLKKALETYENLLEQGIAPEQARAVLPQGTFTEWWWTGSLAAFARIYAQRIDAHAQWEVREYAKAIGELYIAALSNFMGRIDKKL